MYQFEHNQESDQMRLVSLPHTARHPRRCLTALDDEWPYEATYGASPPVSQASYSPPLWRVKDEWYATKEEMRQEIEQLRRQQDALLLKMERMEMDQDEYRPQARSEPPSHFHPFST